MVVHSKHLLLCQRKTKNEKPGNRDTSHLIPGLPDVAWWVSLSLRRALLNHHEYASFSRRLFGGVLKTAGTQRVAETVGPTAANASQHGGFATVDPCWDRQTERQRTVT